MSKPIDPRGPQFAASRHRRRPRHGAGHRTERASPPACSPSRRRCSPSAPAPASSTRRWRGSSAPSSGLASRRRPRWRTPPRRASRRPSGLAFALVGLVGFLAGAPVVGLVATGFALIAALLNAVFGFCLGCELYLILRRGHRHRSVPTYVPSN